MRKTPKITEWRINPEGQRDMDTKWKLTRRRLCVSLCWKSPVEFSRSNIVLVSAADNSPIRLGMTYEVLAVNDDKNLKSKQTRKENSKTHTLGNSGAKAREHPYFLVVRFIQEMDKLNYEE